MDYKKEKDGKYDIQAVVRKTKKPGVATSEQIVDNLLEK